MPDRALTLGQKVVSEQYIVMSEAHAGQISYDLQAYEIWQTHGAWVTQHKPDFGPGVSDRFKMASQITKEEFESANVKRQLIKQHMDQLLGRDGVIALPSAPGPAVRLDTPADHLDDWRRSLLSLTCIAGLAGLPQVWHLTVGSRTVVKYMINDRCLSSLPYVHCWQVLSPR